MSSMTHRMPATWERAVSLVHRWLLCATAFALVLASAPRAMAQDDPCVQYTSCGPCAAQPACGWWGAAGRCMQGGDRGSPYCPGGWAWTDNQCPAIGMPAPPPVVQGPYDPCSRWLNCQSCAAQGSCGWCGATGRC